MEDYKFVGVGKIVLKTFDKENYNIPHLHCLINKTKDGFEVINLEFGLVTFATETGDAVASLARMLIEYVRRTIETKDMGFDTLINVVSRDSMNDFWTEYRKIEFTLAKTKDDVGNQVIDRIKKETIKDFIRQYNIEPEVKFSVLGKVA